MKLRELLLDRIFKFFVVLFNQDPCVFDTLGAHVLDEFIELGYLLVVSFLHLVSHELRVEGQEAQFDDLVEEILRVAEANQLSALDAHLLQLVQQLLRPVPVFSTFGRVFIEKRL